MIARPFWPEETPVVDVRGVEKRFSRGGIWPWSRREEVLAVAGVDLRVAPGEVIALVGQSGSGKTTVSRLVLGLEAPSAGEVLLEGRPWSALTEAQRRPRRVQYQYVPQDAMGALDPQQTALEHIEESFRVLAGHPAAEARQRARELLERLGLGSRLHALPREMSGGEQRRVTIARVLALSPRLVVADEPTSGLDPDRRESVLEALITNLPPRAACILVTHEMSEARAFCHRVYAMLAGRVIEDVDLNQDEPVHPYARILFDPWSAPLPRHGPAEPGCPFRLDCSRVREDVAHLCATTVPALRSVADSRRHLAACHAISPSPPLPVES